MRFVAITSVVLALTLAAAPADARRRAVDQTVLIDEDGNPVLDEDGNQITVPNSVTLEGYCDLNGDDCGDTDGLRLNYTVRLGTEAPIDRIYVHGNGILSFGRPLFQRDLFGSVPNDIFFQNPFSPADLASFDLDLISVGQNNERDFEDQSVFLQSSRLRLGDGGQIIAQWFICSRPSAPGLCPDTSLQSLTLTPTRGGFSALIASDLDPQDAGFVIDDEFTHAPIGQRFLIPATFEGLKFSSAVPEAASWAMLIAGFGLAGASLRRRRAAAA